ncbi:ABC transporter substrate-binding protein [Paracoccus versutus]|uniref:Amino acid/amide ABC transporter substrate-binding protein (HAAT family) n=1 Tax=Paracoccus versutus TaxID=34007 RepID=A0A3D9XYR8_PARVE|nr:ABC transporter substrate-binding protein [Paracoccus versutus]REF73422.1 amino acid/amide ABC transporter substrate-binding protein (HAAT family) [Paracoccus versutus]
MTKFRDCGGALALATLLATPHAGLAQDNGVTVGMALAYSGWMQAYDGEAGNMAELWVEQKNAAGGLLGEQIELIRGDTKTDRVVGAKVGEDLVSQGSDLLVVSCDLDYGSPAALAAASAEIVNVFICAAEPRVVPAIGPYSFTSNTAGQLDGVTMAAWGSKEKSFSKGYVLLDETIEYNKAACAGYDWQMAQQGSEIVGRDSFKGVDPVISSQITRLAEAIRNDAVDHVMFCSTMPGAGSALRQIRAAGIDIPILSLATLDGTYWLDSVPGLKDFYIPVQAMTTGDDPRAEINQLTAAYESRFGQRPSTIWAYPIYAWLDLWAQAVEKVGTTDAEAVVAEMNTYAEVPTVLGPRSFSPMIHIQTNVPLLITEFRDGKQSMVGEWRIDQPIPDNVLFRTKN